VAGPVVRSGPGLRSLDVSEEEEAAPCRPERIHLRRTGGQIPRPLEGTIELADLDEATAAELTRLVVAARLDALPTPESEDEGDAARNAAPHAYRYDLDVQCAGHAHTVTTDDVRATPEQRELLANVASIITA